MPAMIDSATTRMTVKRVAASGSKAGLIKGSLFFRAELADAARTQVLRTAAHESTCNNGNCVTMGSGSANAVILLRIQINNLDASYLEGSRRAPYRQADHLGTGLSGAR